MTWLPDSVNEYGTPVSVAICESCGRTYTICPALVANDMETLEQRRAAWGDGCLADECPSYSLARDADIFFEPMAEAGLINRTEN